jgi:oxalate decarboxylase/phosphoglucose isomerase-like protein (cupin superfamily)
MSQQEQGKIYFLHYRQLRPALPQELSVHPEADLVVDSRSGATVAFKFNEDGTITYVPSWVHWRDNYSKKTGRLKTNAMIAGNSSRVEKTAFTDKRELIEALDAEMTDEHGYTRVLNKKHNRKASKKTKQAANAMVSEGGPTHEQPGS